MQKKLAQRERERNLCLLRETETFERVNENARERKSFMTSSKCVKEQHVKIDHNEERRGGKNSNKKI